MAARLADGPVRYELRVQVAGPRDDPHDPMSVWKGARELLAGHLEVTTRGARPGGRRFGRRVRPGPHRRRDRAVRRPHPSLPPGRVLRIGVPPAESRTSRTTRLATRENPRDRHRWARARTRPGAGPRPGRHRGARRPRQPGHGGRRDAARRRPDVGRVGRGPGRPARHRPRRRRARGAARGRGRRCRHRPRDRLFRAVGGRRAARGVQGVREGRDARRGGAHRCRPALHHRGRGRRRPGRLRPSLRRQGRRSRRREGRGRHLGPAGRDRPCGGLRDGS